MLTIASSVSLIKAFTRFEGTTPAELEFVDRLCQSIDQHLAQLSCQEPNIDWEAHDPALEECVCLGVWAYTVRILRSVPPAPPGCSYVGHRLMAALTQSEILRKWQDHLHLLLWITFMGACTAVDGPMPLRNWYLFELKSVSTLLGTVSWGEVKPILKNFLWLDRCEDFGKLLWSEIDNFGSAVVHVK